MICCKCCTALETNCSYQQWILLMLNDAPQELVHAMEPPPRVRHTAHFAFFPRSALSTNTPGYLSSCALAALHSACTPLLSYFGSRDTNMPTLPSVHRGGRSNAASPVRCSLMLCNGDGGLGLLGNGCLAAPEKGHEVFLTKMDRGLVVSQSR